MIKLFNTLSLKEDFFKPISDNTVGLYTCGPTVYLFAHIGNLRTYLFEDLLKRMLIYNGFEVNHVMNITDVGHLSSNADVGEDKMELSAKNQDMNAWKMAEFYTGAFMKDLERLNIIKPDNIPKATDHIAEQIEMIEKLEKNGYTYQLEDGIYFDVSKFAEYGKLSRQKMDEKQAGARVEVNLGKRNPADFALWKFTASGVKRQMEWDNPWGRRGFPGWHIECSAMSTKYLGQPFDIHCGGIDHIPVHHENEIAQSEAASGKNLANYWLHGEFMLVDGRRMGKSEGNAFLLEDLIKRGFDPLAYRYLCLNTHYRIQLNFTWESLAGAQKALDRLREHLNVFSQSVNRDSKSANSEYKKTFTDAINNDLNMPLALGNLWKLIKDENVANEDKYFTLLDFDRILGLDLSKKNEPLVNIPAEVNELVSKREIARSEKNYKLADEFRTKISESGYEIEDSSDGPKIKKIIA